MAAAENRLAPELVAVVPHLVLDVGELCVVLVVLLALRAVDRRVQRSFHGVYYSKSTRYCMPSRLNVAIAKIIIATIHTKTYRGILTR